MYLIILKVPKVLFVQLCCVSVALERQFASLTIPCLREITTYTETVKMSDVV